MHSTRFGQNEGPYDSSQSVQQVDVHTEVLIDNMLYILLKHILRMLGEKSDSLQNNYNLFKQHELKF